MELTANCLKYLTCIRISIFLLHIRGDNGLYLFIQILLIWESIVCFLPLYINRIHLFYIQIMYHNSLYISFSVSCHGFALCTVSFFDDCERKRSKRVSTCWNAVTRYKSSSIKYQQTYSWHSSYIRVLFTLTSWPESVVHAMGRRSDNNTPMHQTVFTFNLNISPRRYLDAFFFSHIFLSYPRWFAVFNKSFMMRFPFCN